MAHILIFCLAVAAANAASVGRFDFSYDVPNSHSHTQTADGDVIKGYYTVVGADGVARTIHYTADAAHGFVVDPSDDHHEDHPATTGLPPHKDGDDGSYHEGRYENHDENTDDGSYHDDHKDESGDDGTYHKTDEGMYDAKFEHVEDAEDGTYHEEHKTDGQDDGTYHKTDEGMYDAKFEHVEGADDGTYHMDHSTDGQDDGSYHPEKEEHHEDKRDVHEDDGQYHEEHNPIRIVPVPFTPNYVLPHQLYHPHPYAYDFPWAFGTHPYHFLRY